MRKKSVIFTLLLSLALVSGCGSDSSAAGGDASAAGTEPEIIVDDQASSQAGDASHATAQADSMSDTSSDGTADISPDSTAGTAGTAANEGGYSLADKPLYEDFINGSGAAVVGKDVALGYNDDDMSYVGKEVFIDEIAQNIKDASYVELSSLPDISYKLFPGKDGDCLLAVKYTNVGIDGDGDYSTTVIVISDASGSNSITYSFNTWSRCEGYISDDGIYYSSGSGGAGDHYTEYGCFNSDGSYNTIYSLEELVESWIGMTINEEAFEQAYGDGTENETGDFSYTSMAADVITMGGSTYYSYGTFDGSELSDADKKFLELTADCDWKTSDEVNALIKERCDSLGIDQSKLSVGNFIDNWTDR